DAVVLLGVVEDRRVVRPADDVLLRVRNRPVDRLLTGAAWTLVPRRHEILVAAENERGRGDPGQPTRQVYVAHRLTGCGEDLDPVRVAQDLLDRVDRRDALGRLQEALREGLPGDELGEDTAPGAVGDERCDVDPVLENQTAGLPELRR